MNLTATIIALCNKTGLTNSFAPNNEQGDVRDAIEGRLTIGFKVPGFWSEPITLRARVDHGDNFIVEVTHSSGGYEDGVESLAAERAFANALLSVLDFADEVKALAPVFVERQNEARLRKRAEYEEAQRQHQAALAQDPPMGEGLAKKYIAAAIEQAKTGAVIYIEAIPAGNGIGEDRYYVKTDDRISFHRFKYWGARISKRDLIEVLSKASARSFVGQYKNGVRSPVGTVDFN